MKKMKKITKIIIEIIIKIPLNIKAEKNDNNLKYLSIK